MSDHTDHTDTYDCVKAELAEHFAQADAAYERGETVPAEEVAYMRRLAAWLDTHESSLVEVETDELSDATRAEVEAVAEPIVTGLREDREALAKLREEFDTLWERRAVLADTDYEARNAIDSRMKELRETLAVWEACVSIAQLHQHQHHVETAESHDHEGE